jgi:hypothetical protein
MNNLAPKIPRSGTGDTAYEKSARELDVLSDIWDRSVRGVKPESALEIEKTTNLVNPYGTIRRFGRYLLYLLPEDEIDEAARVSSPSRYISPPEARSELRLILPESFYSPVDNAQAQEVEYHDEYGRLGISVSYPELEQEVQGLKLGLNKILGIEYDWSDKKPIIDIVKPGSMPHQPSNMAELEEMRPDTVNLFEIPRLPNGS